jgi:hypothetical protein
MISMAKQVEKFSENPLLKLREYLRGCIYRTVDHDLLRMEFANDTIKNAIDAGWLSPVEGSTSAWIVYDINGRRLG